METDCNSSTTINTMTTEEKRQLLIEFRKYLCEHSRSTLSFIYWPDAERFLSTLPDEGKKSAEEKAFEASREYAEVQTQVYPKKYKYENYHDYKNQTP